MNIPELGIWVPTRAPWADCINARLVVSVEHGRVMFRRFGEYLPECVDVRVWNNWRDALDAYLVTPPHDKLTIAMMRDWPTERSYR